VLEEFFIDEEIESMGYDWWLSGIGRDKFWGGLGEQILFTDRFNLQIVVLQRTRETKLTPYCSYMLQQTLSPEGLRELQLVSEHESQSIADEMINNLVLSQKSKLEDTIFMWSVDPTKPTARENETRHYMCLNLYKAYKKGTIPDEAFYLGSSDDVN
jgi:hypothetical protein